MALTTTSNKPEIVLFDIEIAGRKEDCVIIEFGAFILCPNTLMEKRRPYSKLIRPADPTRIRNFSDRDNGITREAITSAQTFAEIAHEIYELLDGRIWAGHNVREWDGPRIKAAFGEINELAPQPKGFIDSLELLRAAFQRKVGSMALANLAKHFKLGEQKHRSLDDAKMNLEVLKSCATVLFLESSLPDILSEDSWFSPNDIDVEKDDTSIPPISVSLTPQSQKIILLHKNLPLKFFCENMKICFDINLKFEDHSWPRRNFKVYASQRLGIILQACDNLAGKLSAGCPSNSEWQPLVKINAGYDNLPTVKLKLQFRRDGDIPRLQTKIYETDERGEIKQVVINTLEAGELDHLLIRGNFVDAYFSVDTYNYKQRAGILLVAERLIVKKMC